MKNGLDLVQYVINCIAQSRLTGKGIFAYRCEGYNTFNVCQPKNNHLKPNNVVCMPINQDLAQSDLSVSCPTIGHYWVAPIKEQHQS